MIYTCGLYIFDKNDQFLICRPTGIKGFKDGWSIPKGKPENDEKQIDAALRETKEETSLDLSKYKSDIIKIGEQTYKHKKKRLIGFYLKFNGIIDVDKLNCVCLIDDKGPEIDKYEMITYDEAERRIHITQWKLLKEYYESI